jgi:hypothetical protein
MIFNGREIQVIELDDAIIDEYVVEFRDPLISLEDSIIAISSGGTDWSSARISLSPRVDSLSVEFVSWALQVARGLIENDASAM